METGKKKDGSEEKEMDMTSEEAAAANARLTIDKAEAAKRSLEEALNKKGSL